MKSGDTEEVDLEGTAVGTAGVQDQGTAIQGTVRQYLVTPRTLDFEEEAGPSMLIQQEERSTSDDENIVEMLINMSKPRGISIPGVDQSQAAQSSQPTQALDPKDKGKGIMIEPKKKKKKKLTLADLKAIEDAKNEEAARKMQAEWDAEIEKSQKPVVQLRPK